MKNTRIEARGVTLLELMVVMMLLSLILTAAVKTWDITLQRGRFESTKKKLDQLATAIVGDPEYVVDGRRADFGYVGDMGSLPQTLTQLVEEPVVPHPESSGWKGPYLRATFDESPEGYRFDGWGDTIVYNPESLFVRSYGGYGLSDPTQWMTRPFHQTRTELLNNAVDGQVLDLQGNPPPDVLLHRVVVWLIHRREGVVLPEFQTAGANGAFSFIGVAQGVHFLRVVYTHDLPPPVWADTVVKYVTVNPRAGARGVLVRMNIDWDREVEELP